MKHVLITVGETKYGICTTSMICDALSQAQVPWRGFDLDDRNIASRSTWGLNHARYCPLTRGGALPVDDQGQLDLEELGARIQPMVEAILDPQDLTVIVIDLGANDLKPFITALTAIGFPNQLPLHLIVNCVVIDEKYSATALAEAWRRYGGNPLVDWFIIKDEPDAKYGLFDHHAAETIAAMKAAGATAIEMPYFSSSLRALWERASSTTFQEFANKFGQNYLVNFQWQRWLTASRVALLPLVELTKSDFEGRDSGEDWDEIALDLLLLT